MSVSAFEHHEFMEHVKEQWGPKIAETMMNLLPVVGWAEVATKRDVEEVETRLTAKIEGLGTELRGEMSELRGEIGELRGQMSRLGGAMDALRGEMNGLHGQMDGLRGEMNGLRCEIKGDLARATRSMYFAVVASNVSIAGLVLAAVNLG